MRQLWPRHPQDLVRTTGLRIDGKRPEEDSDDPSVLTEDIRRVPPNESTPGPPWQRGPQDALTAMRSISALRRSHVGSSKTCERNSEHSEHASTFGHTSVYGDAPGWWLVMIRSPRQGTKKHPRPPVSQRSRPRHQPALPGRYRWCRTSPVESRRIARCPVA